MDFGDFLWSLLIIYFMFFYFMLLFRIVGDLFRDSETSGLGKTAWIIFLLFLPFIAMIVYRRVAGGDRGAGRVHPPGRRQRQWQGRPVRADREGARPARVGCDLATGVRRPQGQGARVGGGSA
jgi:hypothetical protein